MLANKLSGAQLFPNSYSHYQAIIVYSYNKACLLWLVKPRDTESLQFKRFLKKSYRLSLLVYKNNKP